MKKKILSLVLVVAMLASMLVFAPVSGASEKPATLELGNAIGAAGDTVVVDLTVTTEAFAGIQFLLDYDETKLTFNNIEWTTEFGAGFPSDFTNEKENYGAFLDEGTCDKVLAWATGTGVGAVDFSAGVVLATLSFTINAGAPAGDAFVGFIAAGSDSNKVNYGSGSYTSENIDFVNGAVTILPSGYTSLTPTDASLFKIDTAEDMDAGEIECIAEYTGEYGGTIVIPEIHTVLNYRLFSGIDKDTTIIVPASIELVGTQCFRRPAANVTVTVIFLGDDTEFEDEAFSTRSSNGKFVVISAPGSTAQTVAQETSDALADDDIAEWVTWKAPEDVNLTVNGVTYLVPTDAKAPGVMAIGDETVIGWKSNDGKTYGAGETMALTGATTLTPKTIKTPKMNTGVSFSVGATVEESKMRFTTDISVEDYNALVALAGDEKKVTFGTLISPAAVVSNAGGLTFEALEALSDAKGGVQTYIDVPATGTFKKTETTHTYAGSLAGFLAENINRAYAAAFYATVELADGSSFTVYSAFDFGEIRSVNEAITAMTGVQGFGGLTDPQAAALREMIAGNQ